MSGQTLSPVRPLRVLIISEYPYRGIVVGGVHAAVQVLATALSRLPEIEKVLVLSFRPDIDEDLIIDENAKLTIHHIAGQRRLTLPTRSIFDLIEAKRIALDFKPDIVHGQGTGAHGEIATRLGYPSVITIHGVGTVEAEMRERNKKFVGPIRIWLTRKMVQRVVQSADVLISISEFDKEHFAGIRDSYVLRIPNAVRPEFFSTEPVSTNPHRILFGGLVIERKNVAGIVRAFNNVKKHVPEAILDIAGPMPDDAYHREVVRNIDPAVRADVVFHGNLNTQSLASLMSTTSVCVLFSHHENLPVIIAEALALGKPVVSSRVGAASEMVQDGVNGFLVESGDEDALADRLISLLNNNKQRTSMGLNGRKRAAECWKPESVAMKTISAYNLAGERKNEFSLNVKNPMLCYLLSYLYN